MRFLLFLSPLLFSAALTAQACSDLSVSGDGSPGSTLTFGLTGAAADVPAVILVGTTEGSTTLSLGPIGSIELGLAMPFVPLLAGTTDGNGDVSVEFTLPPGNYPEIDLFAQGLTIDFSVGNGGPPSLDACTSDVEGFAIGTGS